MQFKRGDTFDFFGPIQVLSSTGAVVNLSGWSLEAQIRFPEANQVKTVSATWNGSYDSIRAKATSTSDWPLGVAEIDIRLTSTTGDVISTETARFDVVEGPSNA